MSGGWFGGATTDTTSDATKGDEDIYIKPSNSEGHWIRHFHDMIYVERFGVKGDGVANDQPAPNAC